MHLCILRFSNKFTDTGALHPTKEPAVTVNVLYAQKVPSVFVSNRSPTVEVTVNHVKWCVWSFLHSSLLSPSSLLFSLDFSCLW